MNVNYPKEWFNLYKKLTKTELFYFVISMCQLNFGEDVTEEKISHEVKKEAKLWAINWVNKQ